ncbi:transcription initiation factor TFIID subunit 2 isoform X2 [Durio zibethinus]|uniref:Transcription initiation factor TFIID subunit 2 n=1 Tax=Durio zibethinus TaxID=66656 RepID=A0A6P5YED8_DURZI|nr:transcription initiation factor TFIID subunit 2 isoform X2 [Durio zibethinus]
MAKPRKPKPEDPKPANSGAVVRHQKLCLSIDTNLRRIYGYTQLEIEVPDIGIVGLHAENLGIESVLVDGDLTEFEYYPHNQGADSEKRWASAVSSPISAADAAAAAYVTALEMELIPNLLINCCNKMQIEPVNTETNGDQSSAEVKQNVKSIRVNYWVEKMETGIHFEDNVVHTDNQLRRSRCWFPCIDGNNQRCCYDLEFTVAHNLVAVSNGTLLYQVLSRDDPPHKTYVYRLDVPVTSQWISLAVGPFEILPDQHNGLISHMCLPPDLPKLRNTVEFFHSAFSEYEQYLDAKFPFGSYKQVFLSPEMAISSSNFGASLSILSSQVLFDEKVIDQTIDTCIKLAFALARQWFGVYITPEAPNDEWLLDGLAGFLTDLFIKKFLGNNEARYRRYKANCAVCKADDSGATALGSSFACKDLYGTHSIGLLGNIRSWKSVAILQMLEKQMGPDFFKKILQAIIYRAQNTTCPVRSLSTKEFRHFANKIGNLERPFLKEFFPRWVGSYGCPVLRMGFSYNKRKNIIELAVLRECTATIDSSVSVLNANPDSENHDGDIGWPGVMTVRVYELDGMSDHPDLPMAGDAWQLLEIACHSKLAARRYQKPKKGSKPDGSDDNGDIPTVDMRSSVESPLLWIRADPEMEYLAEIHFNQPVQMWINQLEKDEDVVAQAQAITALESLPELSFSVVKALNNFLTDSKAFWRVRIEAAFALASTSSEETDFTGLQHLVKFYKSRRFDADIGLPKPNDFRDFPEYFVLEAIPRAVAMVRAADRKSPREAVEFVLQLLKSMVFLSSLLKRIDRLLQFDRLMPSYNGILTTSCIRTLAQIALKLSGFIHLDHVFELIKPFRDFETIWQVRIEASRALLDLEFHCNGIDAALLLFIKYIEEEPSLRGQVKLGVHAMRLCQIQAGSVSNEDIKETTLVALLQLLESRTAFNNVFLRHYLFCILQVLAGRSPTLYGLPKDKLPRIGDVEICHEQKNNFAALVAEMKPSQPSADNPSLHDTSAIPEASKELDTVSNSHERKTAVVKIRVKQSATTSKAEEADNGTVERSQGGERSQGKHHDTDRGATSSVSVDAPQRNSAEAVSISNQNIEEVNSFHDHGSRITASIGSAKIASEGDNFGKELQCTADSDNVSVHPDDPSSPSIIQDNYVDAEAQKYASLQTLSVSRHDGFSLGAVDSPFREKEKGKKKKKKEKKVKENKRKREDHKGDRDNPEYLEKKRLKKEKKQKEKEMAMLLSEVKATSTELRDKKEEPTSLTDLPGKKEEVDISSATVQLKPSDPHKVAETRSEPKEGTSAPPKFRIKIKNKTLNKS